MKALLTTFMILAGCACCAQKQLVVVRKDNVLLRLKPGDEIVLKIKGTKRRKVSYVNNLLAGAVVLHRDTVSFHQIDKIYFKRFGRLNLIGGILLFGGVSMLAIDQLNNSVIQGNEASFDRGFTSVTAGIAAAGLPLFAIRKNYARLNGRTRMLTVDKSSIFYKPDPKGFDSPYLPDN